MGEMFQRRGGVAVLPANHRLLAGHVGGVVEEGDTLVGQHDLEHGQPVAGVADGASRDGSQLVAIFKVGQIGADGIVHADRRTRAFQAVVEVAFQIAVVGVMGDQVGVSLLGKTRGNASQFTKFVLRTPGIPDPLPYM